MAVRVRLPLGAQCGIFHSNKNIIKMAKEKQLSQEDLRTLRNTVFIEDELRHKQNKKNKKRRCKVSRVWDAEKGKYVKVKKQLTRTKMNKKEMEEFFGHKWEQPTKIVIMNTKPAVHAKSPIVNIRPVTSVMMCGSKLVWDEKTLRYKKAA